MGRETVNLSVDGTPSKKLRRSASPSGFAQGSEGGHLGLEEGRVKVVCRFYGSAERARFREIVSQLGEESPATRHAIASGYDRLRPLFAERLPEARSRTTLLKRVADRNSPRER